MIRIGLISDTHGLLRPEALRFLRGADHIIHAGDIGAPEILEQLKTLAPVTAVRGNNDRARWAKKLPLDAVMEVGGVAIHVLHDLNEMRRPEGRVVITGHSHKPKVEERDGVLYVNPGSAGPRRFTLPVAAGELRISGAGVRARIKELL
ncbi:MAG TPA: metallophosphoesterase family protein [Burkholderiales bacterium]|nr:metallophosphoesterase family protein [Burkholderiales bacterium]